MIEYRYELQCNGEEFRVMRIGTEKRRGMTHYHAPEMIGYPGKSIDSTLQSAARQEQKNFKIDLGVWHE